MLDTSRIKRCRCWRWCEFPDGDDSWTVGRGHLGGTMPTKLTYEAESIQDLTGGLIASSTTEQPPEAARTEGHLVSSTHGYHRKSRRKKASAIRPRRPEQGAALHCRRGEGARQRSIPLRRSARSVREPQQKRPWHQRRRCAPPEGRRPCDPARGTHGDEREGKCGGDFASAPGRRDLKVVLKSPARLPLQLAGSRWFWGDQSVRVRQKTFSATAPPNSAGVLR